MDEVLFKLIESERVQDESLLALTDSELAPTGVFADSEGAVLRVFSDGSVSVHSRTSER